MFSPSDERDLGVFENKVTEVMRILEMMTNASDSDDTGQPSAIQLADQLLDNAKDCAPPHVDEFIVKIKENRTVINKKDDHSLGGPIAKDKFTFMTEMERDAEKRAEDRRQRTDIAELLRRLGNQAFRQCNYENAISYYNKSIDQVKDSPVLYNNRAVTYIRLKLFRRAISDCDFVLNKLDEKNLRSWMYRAAAYYALEEKRNFDKSIAEARKTNPKETQLIDQMIGQITEGQHEQSHDVMMLPKELCGDFVDEIEHTK